MAQLRNMFKPMQGFLPGEPAPGGGNPQLPPMGGGGRDLSSASGEIVPGGGYGAPAGPGTSDYSNYGGQGLGLGGFPSMPMSPGPVSLPRRNPDQPLPPQPPRQQPQAPMEEMSLPYRMPDYPMPPGPTRQDPALPPMNAKRRAVAWGANTSPRQPMGSVRRRRL